MEYLSTALPSTPRSKPVSVCFNLCCWHCTCSNFLYFHRPPSLCCFPSGLSFSRADHNDQLARTGWVGEPSPTFELSLTRQAAGQTRVECTHASVMGSDLQSDYRTCDFIDDYCFNTCDSGVFGGTGEWPGVRPEVPTLATPFVNNPGLMTNAPTNTELYNAANYTSPAVLHRVIPRVRDMVEGMHVN